MTSNGIRSTIAERRLWVLPPVLALLLTMHADPAKSADQRAATIDLTQTVAETTAATDEVIVSGRLSTLSDLRKAIVAAEDRYYARFNELSDGWLHDIDCEVRAPTGTRLKVRTCEARYVIEAKRDAAISLLRNTNANVRLDSGESLVNTKLAEQRRRMLDIAMTDKEVQRALIERALLTERFDAVRKEKLAAGHVIWN